MDELGNHEIQLDVIDFLTQPALNIGYEKINDSYSSYGADLFFNFNDNNASSSWSDKFSFNPFKIAFAALSNSLMVILFIATVLII